MSWFRVGVSGRFRSFSKVLFPFLGSYGTGSARRSPHAEYDTHERSSPRFPFLPSRVSCFRVPVYSSREVTASPFFLEVLLVGTLWSKMNFHSLYYASLCLGVAGSGFGFLEGSVPLLGSYGTGSARRRPHAEYDAHERSSPRFSSVLFRFSLSGTSLYH